MMQIADASQHRRFPPARDRCCPLSPRLRHRGAVVGLMGMVALLAGCTAGEQQQQPNEPPTVGVVEVTEQKVNPFYEFVGRTRAAESVALRARVTGFLQERNFQEGGKVDKEQVLFRIEPEQYQASLAQAEASLGAAEASLNRAQVDLKRFQELRKNSNISQQEVDKTQAEVLVQEAAVATARADIEKARLNVDYTEVIAPITGRIDAAALDVGNLIGPDSGVLATINLMDPIKAAFSIAETWYYELSRQEIEGSRRADGEDFEAEQSDDAADEWTHVPLIRLPDGSIYEHPGEFDFIDNKVDETTGTVLVRAVFPNPDRLLLPGQFVNLVIERKQAVDRVLIPQSAVLTDQGGTYVLAVNDQDQVEARRIETGQRFGPNLVVNEGLAPGERIVLYGIQKVRPGLTVKPEPAAAPSDPMDNATEASVAVEETGGAEQLDATAIESSEPDRSGLDSKPPDSEPTVERQRQDESEEEDTERASEASSPDPSRGERQSAGDAG